MHNINYIRDNPTEFDNAMKLRGEQPMSSKILEIDKIKRETQTVLQNLLSEKNILSKKIGKLKSINQDAKSEISNVEELKDKINSLKELENIKENELISILNRLPNIPDKSVPNGKEESDNILYREWGNKPKFNFKPKIHYDIGENLGLINFDIASKLSGSRFVVLKKQISRLERAIANFMLDKHTLVNGYIEYSVPFLVKNETLFGTGQLPKFGEDLFTAGDDHWLIPTAEVPLTNLVRNQILNVNQLPMRSTSYTPCFRSEAGAAGKDTRGMLRMHQFYKVEIVSFVTSENGINEHLKLTDCAEDILKQLKLPYRVMSLCAGDLGFSSCKTYDLEVWIPSQDKYREISSCSYFGDFQSRRMNTRYIDTKKKYQFVHTINGSGLAVGRALVAIMENYQQSDGSIKIPDVLIPYMSGIDYIKVKN